MNLLWICNLGRNRSRTAAELYGGRYAGIYSESRPVTRELLEWADVIVTLDADQRAFLAEHFPEMIKKRVVTLDIPDVYRYGEERLVQKLKERVAEMGVLEELK